MHVKLNIRPVGTCGTNNNDFILYKDIGFGNGAEAVQAGVTNFMCKSLVNKYSNAKQTTFYP
jgi:hypothetical protein